MSAMGKIVVVGIALTYFAITAEASARPIGGSFLGGRPGVGPAGGALFGVEGGWAATLADGGDSGQGAWAFGIRAGYEFANGLEVHVRYDDLGTKPLSSRSPLQFGTVGLRYSVPFLFPMPFAEVDAGPAFVLGDTRFGAGAALGVSFPVVNHLLIDLAGHDWFVPIAGAVRQTLTVGLSLAVTFGGPQ